MEVSKVWDEWRTGHENLLLKFSTTGDVIDRKFVRLDKELERVVELVRQKLRLGLESSLWSTQRRWRLRKGGGRIWR